MRNCGLMLLKALTNRMNGGTDIISANASISRRKPLSLVYAKYGNLSNLLLNLLSPSSNVQHSIEKSQNTAFEAQRVFPALEIIERSGLPKCYEREIGNAVWKHIEGPIWSIRNKAAKAASLLCDERKVPTEFRRILAKTWSTQNALHGRLLYIRCLAARLQRAPSGCKRGNELLSTNLHLL